MKTSTQAIREAFPGTANKGLRARIRGILADETRTVPSMGMEIRLSVALSPCGEASLAALEGQLLAGVEWT